MGSKTYIIDFDGTCIYHYSKGLSAQVSQEVRILPGVREAFDEWSSEGCKIILMTGRPESLRKKTAAQIQAAGLYYDQLVMGVGNGVRVLINDTKPTCAVTAEAVVVERNTGLENVTG